MKILMIFTKSFVVILLIQAFTCLCIDILGRFRGFHAITSTAVCTCISTHDSSFTAVPYSNTNHVLLVPVRAQGHNILVDKSEQFMLKLNNNKFTLVEQFPI
jgi:hypothetical protein